MISSNRKERVHQNDLLPMDIQEPKEWILQVPGVILSKIPTFAASLRQQIDSHDVSVLHYAVHGKDFIKSVGMSPDSYVQMAIQLAYFKLMGTWAATYESAGMKRYAWGRTETCRSVSLESVDFVKAMEDLSASVCLPCLSLVFLSSLPHCCVSFLIALLSSFLPHSRYID